MAFRLYKEGQGAKARGLLAFLVGGTGIFAAVRCYEYFRGEGVGAAGFFEIPFFNWSVSWASIVAILILGVFLVAGVWLYNNRRLSDFLIDTEGELTNKVTWPTRKETVNNSIVVVVACVLMAIWVVVADLVFKYLKDVIYRTGG